MVTGASGSNAALILIDAQNGVREQTIRHSYISSLLQLQHLIVCINKMDLVNYSESVYQKIIHEFKAFASKLDIKDISYIPLSALLGENVVKRSEKMNWYQGATLLYTLENIHISSDNNSIDPRFPIQRTYKSELGINIYSGRIAGGVFKPGDEVLILPGEIKTRISKIHLDGKEFASAFAPSSVSMELEDSLEISRGFMVAKPNNFPQSLSEIDAVFCWLGNHPLNVRSRYLLQQTTGTVSGTFSKIIYKLNIETLHRDEEDKSIGLNDIFRARIGVDRPIFADSYRRNRITGSFILIDENNAGLSYMSHHCTNP